MSQTNEPNVWVHVNDTIDVKFAALREHKSQIKDPANWKSASATGCAGRIWTASFTRKDSA